MFRNFLEWIRSVIRKMFNGKLIGDKLKVDIAVSTDMIRAIELWADLYENKAPWLENEDIVSLELPSAIAREIATLVVLEYKSEITGSARADWLNEQYKKIKKELRKQLEYGCAKGGLVIKPYVSGTELSFDFVQADSFFPTEYDSTGKCTAGIFVCQKIISDEYYTRLEYHQLQGTTYLVINKAYKSSDKNTLGDPISLDKIEEWAELEEETTIKNVKSPLFGYFKTPFANTVDTTSPLGVSVYSRAIKLIEEADKQFSRILWEYEGSELAIDADVTTLQQSKVNEKLKLPKLKERLFRAAGQNKDGSSFYNIFSPEIRDSSLFNGLNNILKRIEFNCGLAYGTISDPQMIEKTAEEIKTSKQRSYSTVTDIQGSLEDALNDTVYAMDVLTTLYHLAPLGKYETSHEWDDSILVDAKSEQSIMMQEVNSGIIKKIFYLMKRYGVTEEQAMEMIPQETEPEENTEDEE